MREKPDEVFPAGAKNGVALWWRKCRWSGPYKNGVLYVDFTCF
jgi:hypothetical protein